MSTDYAMLCRKHARWEFLATVGSVKRHLEPADEVIDFIQQHVGCDPPLVIVDAVDAAAEAPP